MWLLCWESTSSITALTEPGEETSAECAVIVGTLHGGVSDFFDSFFAFVGGWWIARGTRDGGKNFTYRSASGLVSLKCLSSIAAALIASSPALSPPAAIYQSP